MANMFATGNGKICRTLGICVPLFITAYVLISLLQGETVLDKVAYIKDNNLKAPFSWFISRTKAVKYGSLRMEQEQLSFHTILFTTFKNTTDRLWIQSKVVLNWSKLRPNVQPVLFTDGSDYLTNLARKHGWIIYPIQRTNEYGTPHLKPMFQYVQRYFNTTFYMFSNGDILYDTGFVNTLTKLKSKLHLLKNIFITGQRWNYFIYNNSIHTLKDMWKPETVRHFTEYSKLFRKDAEDYFIVTREFPWRFLKDIVIGRPAYDNYLLAMANMLGVNTIDATNTITAIHLSPKGSVFQGKPLFFLF